MDGQLNTALSLENDSVDPQADAAVTSARGAPAKNSCLVCGGELTPKARPWLTQCRSCGFWRSSLWDPELWDRKESELDEAHREPGIQAVREQNAALILDSIDAIAPLHGKRLLDIGCGYGWFLQAATRRGLTVVGVEPEERIASAARGAGQPVVTGCFPEALDPGERFDVITFNDVLEHIPDAEGAVRACFEHLRPGGLLAINIPSSDGVIYRTALAMSAAGSHGPLDRMWQKNFHSPHVSYFNPRTLDRFVERFGFRRAQARRLETVRLNGLWNRICMDRTQSRIAGALMYVGLAAAVPVIRLAPADIILHVYRKGE